MSESNHQPAQKHPRTPRKPKPDQNGAAPDGQSESEESKVRDAFAEYGAPDWPMSSYAGLVVTYNLAFAAFLLAAKQMKRPLPEKIPAGDILLMALGAHRLGRLLTRDYATSPIRAPFTRYEGPGLGPAETKEKPRGNGVQQAIGELLTCPWCASQWAASFLMYGLVLSPRVTRIAASILAAVDISDFLNVAYTAAEKRM